MTTTSFRLKAALDVYARNGFHLSDREAHLLVAIAAMLDCAGTKDAAAVAKGRAVFGYLKQEVEQFRAWLADSDGFVTVGRWWLDNELTQEDLITFARWVRDGGLSWMDAKPSWRMFTKYGPDWMTDALADNGVDESDLTKLREEEGDL